MNKDSLILCFVNMMSSMGYSLIAPLYPSLARSKGVNDDICGVIIAIFALTSICISPFIPTLINMFGKRNVLYSSILLSGVSSLLYSYLEQVINLSLFLLLSVIIRILHGMAASVCSTVVYSITATITKSDELSNTLGKIEVAFCLGFAIGPLIASLFYYLGGYSAPFYFLVTVSFTSLVLCRNLRLSNETNRHKPEFLKSLLKLDVMIVSCSITIEMISKTFIFPTFSNYLVTNFDLKVETASLLFMVHILSYSLMLNLINKIIKLLGFKLTMMVGLLLISIAVLLLPPISLFPKSLIIVLVGLLLMGITSASIYIPSILELMRILNVSNTDEGVTNDVASAIFFLSLNCGEIIGPTLGGYLTKKFDFEFSCIFTSLIAFLYFLMMSWINLDSIRLLYHKLYDFKNYNNCLVAKENESTKKCLINEDEYFPR